MSVDRPVSRIVHRQVSRAVVRGSSDFPEPDYRNVYQANALANAVTGALAGIDAQDFILTFDLYVIAHTATVRPIMGLTSGFGVAAQTSWQAVIQADDQLAISVRNGDAAGFLESATISIATGKWVKVTASFQSDTLSIEADGNSNSVPITNRIGVGDLPFAVFGSALASDQMQISNINISYPAAARQYQYPCAEGSGLVMKDYIAKDLSSPSNGVINDESIHQIRL